MSGVSPGYESFPVLEDTQATVQLSQLGLTEEERKESEALLRLLSSGTQLITPKVHRLPKLPRNRSQRGAQRSTSPSSDYYSPSAIRRRASQANGKISAKLNVSCGNRDVSYLSEGKQPRSNYQAHSSMQLLSTLGYGGGETHAPDLPTSVNQLEASGKEPLASLSVLEGVAIDEFSAPLPLNPLKTRIPAGITPANRKEVAALAGWVERMQAQALLKHGNSPSELFHRTQLIYTTCLGQIVKQVTAQCAERGLLLEKVWRAYVGLFEKAIETYKAEKEADDEKYVKTISNLHKRFALDSSEVRRQSTEHEAHAIALTNQLQALQDAYDKLTVKDEKLVQRNKYLQEAFEMSEQRLLSTEEELESLRRIMNGSVDDYKAGVPGSKQMLQAMARALVPKEKSDPMKMAEDIFKHQLTDFMQTQEYAEISPFHDSSTQYSPTTTTTVSSFTDIYDFPDPPVSVLYDPAPELTLSPPDTPKNNENTLSSDMTEEQLWDFTLFSVSKVVQLTGKATEMGVKLPPGVLLPSIQAINQGIIALNDTRKGSKAAIAREISHLTLELTQLSQDNTKLTQEIAQLRSELANCQSTPPPLTLQAAQPSLQSSDSQSPKERSKGSTARRSPTRPHDFRFNRRRPVSQDDTHPSTGVLDTVLQGAGGGSGVSQKSLLKHLNAVWGDYGVQTRGSEGMRNVTFVAFMYDWHLMKYGLKKVAEAKMFQVLTSIQRLKSHCPRIFLYGRMCGLYDKMSVEDIRFYQTLQECLGKL